MVALAPSLPRPGRAGVRPGRALRVADRASSVLCALALVLLGLVFLVRLAGYRPLIDYSSSMRPAINAGDVLISHGAPAQSIRPGDIVSFSDRALQGRLVTHRVLAVHAEHQRLYFLTRGDANAAPERWSVARMGSVAKVDLRIPAVGWAAAWLNSGLARTATLSLLALALGAALLRRIWSA
ncbi:MAG TPA: signal peptidase I [Solirubrobacteraceae bacterium]|jgi:signal peptidase|nr:signal peptidase I [Solirubrobacteraceae bacterium]